MDISDLDHENNRSAYGILEAMKGGNQPHGFTIVEALIFLAVSGILLASAVTLIQGKQNMTEFSEGIRQVDNNLQDVMSNVSVGYYPRTSTNNFTCSQSGSSVVITSSSDAGGDNFYCQFLGEAIQFAPAGHDDQYVLYPVAGLKYSNLGNLTPITDISQASPTVITTNIQTYNLPYGITVGNIDALSHPASVPATGPATLGLFLAAATNPLSSVGNTTGINGNNSVNLTPISNNIGDAEGPATVQGTAENYIQSPGHIPSYWGTDNPTTGVQICLNSGTTNQYGIITIGGDGNPTNVSLKIESGSC